MKTTINGTTARKRVEDFMDYDFDNRCNLPEDCIGDYPHQLFFKKHFIPVIRREIKKMASDLGANLVFTPGYFEISGFFSINGECVYFSIGDFRRRNWYDAVLYRCARDTKDYRGGVNRYCRFNELKNSIQRLIEYGINN